MARKGQSRHLKRFKASTSLKLPRKSIVWTVKPAPGPHPSKSSIPLRLLIRDYFTLARTAKEADRILSESQVLVDGRTRRDPKFPVGLMDVIQLPSVNRNYRILLDRRGRLIPHEIPEAEASFKLCKVTRKAFIRGGKIQLTFHDGKTLMGEFREFAPRDVVKLTLPELKVVERIPFGKDALALITGGSNVGKTGKIIEIKIIERAQSIVTLQTSDGSTFQAPEDYVFVIGRERPLISLEGAR